MKPHELEQLGPDLSAYLDGELDDERRAEIDQLLAESDEARQLLEDLRDISAHISQLPRKSAPVQLSDTLKKATEERMATTLVTQHKRRAWWLVGVEVSAAAAVLLFAVYLGWSGFGKTGDVNSSSATVKDTPTVAMAQKNEEASTDDQSIRSKHSNKRDRRVAPQEDPQAGRQLFSKAEDDTELEDKHDYYWASNSSLSDIQLLVSAPTADSYRRNVIAVTDNIPSIRMSSGTPSIQPHKSVQPDDESSVMIQQEFDGSLVDVMDVVNAIRDGRETGVGIKLSNIPVYDVKRQPYREAGRRTADSGLWKHEKDGRSYKDDWVDRDELKDPNEDEFEIPEWQGRMYDLTEPNVLGRCTPKDAFSVDREHSEPLPIFEGVPIVDPVLTMIRDSVRELLRPMQGVTESYRVLIQIERVEEWK